MKKVSIIINVVLYVIIFMFLTASIGSTLMKKPFLMTAIRSNSMYPQLKRGDMVFIMNVNKNTKISKEDIIVFKTDVGSYSSKGEIMHRVISINDKNEYITKGDANDYNDVEIGGTIPVNKEMIESKAIVIDNMPLKIPLLGYVTLALESLKNYPYTLPVMIFVIVVILCINEIIGSKKIKRKQNDKIYLPITYMIGGLIISIIFFTTMLTSSQILTLNYEVSDETGGVMSGSSIGVVKTGESITKPLVNLENKGFFTSVSTITSNDRQISFDLVNLYLHHGQKVKTNISVKGTKAGLYKSKIWVGNFMPLLPQSVIYKLASINFYLALSLVSAIPGIPLILYPFIDYDMRLIIKKKVRRMMWRARSKFSF